MALSPDDIETVLAFLAAVLGDDEGSATVADLVAWASDARAVSAAADYLAAAQAADYEDTPQTVTALARVVDALSRDPGVVASP